MGNCCCCSIEIMITKKTKTVNVPIKCEHDSSVHNHERSGGSRAFEIVDEKILELYRTRIVNSGSSNSTNRNSCGNSYTNSKIIPMNIHNQTNIRKSFSHPNYLNTIK